jgi:hypothetical protein
MLFDFSWAFRKRLGGAAVLEGDRSLVPRVRRTDMGIVPGNFTGNKNYGFFALKTGKETDFQSKHTVQQSLESTSNLSSSETK